ncbi:FAD-binding oxidoreductase [Paenibacillus xylanilyticus]|uniref:FAD-binding oxidoreductase n=1 Tax=Paenibacillus xylanilyticus TaxID=248903 RepID=A0A7Y6BX85_9BACL|nr:FAD-binding oxidoreductase [Paenibacillus xylanilyticus]NUU76491.1 FAD-binding oxidoreductase [Paenibacillus xylanilyticus]
MVKKTSVLLLLLVLCIWTYWRTGGEDQNPYLITDYSRLHPVKVERVVQGHQEQQLVELLKDAKDHHLTVSIAGQRHSQGGHTYYRDGIVIDMTSYNQILDVQPEAKKITVQAGATWADVQRAINPYGLSLKNIQSQNIFTVGGSISVNAHGRELRNGSLIQSVESFRLLTADGQIREVSRTSNSELFPLVLGGYGLFGLILDVTLSLTEDELYRLEVERMEAKDYPTYFQKDVLRNPNVRMHLARLSLQPGKGYFSDMYALNYAIDSDASLQDYNDLALREQGVLPAKILFNLNRGTGWGREWFWELQQRYFDSQAGTRISRNNAMASPSAFMEYHQPGANDLLQEYFIPVDAFPAFVEEMGEIVSQEQLDLLNITVRYVKKDEEAVLSYATQDMFGLVCLFHASLSDEEQKKFKASLQRIIVTFIRLNGTYYLPYEGYATAEQFEQAYARKNEFFAAKEHYDPEHVFMNYFMEQYGGDGK